MKKEILFICMLAFAIALSGCIQMPDLFPEDLTGFKNCEDSDECIKSALESCEKAYATKTDDTSDGMIMTAKIVVYGLEEGKCKIKFKIEKIEISEDLGDAEVLGGVFVSMLQGKEMICLIPPNETKSMGGFADPETMMEYCTGSLIDLMMSMQGITS